MSGDYSRGMAFIMEGATEKVFYRSFLKWIAEQKQCTFEKGEDLENNQLHGFPRGGMSIQDSEIEEHATEVIEKWIQL